MRAAHVALPPDAAGFSLLPTLGIANDPTSSLQQFPLAPSRGAREAVVVSDLRVLWLVTRPWMLRFDVHSGEGQLFRRIPSREKDGDGIGARAHGAHFIESSEKVRDLWYAPELGSVRDSLLLALLRWRARQDPLSLVLSQMNPRPVARGSGTGRESMRNGRPRKARVVDSAASLITALRGSEAERDLQIDVQNALRLLKS